MDDLKDKIEAILKAQGPMENRDGLLGELVKLIDPIPGVIWAKPREGMSVGMVMPGLLDPELQRDFESAPAAARRWAKLISKAEGGLACAPPAEKAGGLSWVLVSDRLPEAIAADDGTYPCSPIDSVICAIWRGDWLQAWGKQRYCEDGQWRQNDQIGFVPTHWMPVPRPTAADAGGLTFDKWFEREYPIDHNGRRARCHGNSIMGLMRAAWNARPTAVMAGGLPPVDMILNCPSCGLQHIDAPDARKAPAFGPGMDVEPWTNPPHRSHLCHGCGHIWRPADVPTNGVKAIQTKGQGDSPAAVMAGALSAAGRDVLAERQRQIVKDWTPEHDDAHPNGEIAAFAALYAMPPAARDWPASETGYGDTFGSALCPESWQPKFGDRRRELIKAGALTLAEIERIDRATANGAGGQS